MNEVRPHTSPAAAYTPTRRSFLRSATAFGVAVPFASWSISACTAETGSSSGGAGSTTLRVRTGTDMHNLDPAFWTSKEDANIAECILEGLVSFAPGTFDLVNTLAAEFELADDAMSYRFKLKQGIPFHGDYGEVTSADVKFSYERIAGILKPDIKAVYKGDWAALAAVDLDGKYGGIIRLKQPFSPLERTTLPVMSGKILSEAAVKDLGDKFATELVGSGPYQLDEWVPDQQTTLSRFADYGGASSEYAEPPVWEQIVISPITEDVAAANAMRTGTEDFGEVGLSFVDTIDNQAGWNLEPATTTTYQFLSMNVEDEILSDIRVRQAIRLAVDVPSILEAAYEGRYRRANAIVAEEMGLGYWADAPERELDLAEAQRLMDEAGVGEITLRLTTLNAQAERTAAQVIQSNLKEIGITVDLEIQGAAALYEIPGDGGGGPNRQLVYLNYVTEPDPHWAFVWWTKEQIGLWNFTNWTDPKFEAGFNSAAEERDEAKRTQTYVDMQELWDESASVVWIAYWVSYFASTDQIEPSLRPDASPIYWNTAKA